MAFRQRSGSSSTADEEREAPRLEKKASPAASLKRRFKRKSKVEKGSFSGEDDFNKITEKKDKGFLNLMRKGRSKNQKTLDALELEVEVKTTKDIEMIIEKYTAKKTSSQNQPGSEVDNNLEGDDDAGEDKDDFRDEDQQFENAKRKLRLVLCQADFQNLPLLHPDNRVAEETLHGKRSSQELMTFLHVQLAEAINLQDRALSTQLHETIRSVRELPPHSCSKLIDALENEYKLRSPYLAYLVNAHQGLLATHAHLERLVERVERDKIICRNYFIMTCVKLFLESKEKGEINAFSLDFQALPIPDEKCDLLEEFLEKLADEMRRHPIWTGASEEHLQDTFVATERAIMSSIFKFAFYPNGEVDMERDRTFYEHVSNLQKVIHPNHKAVRVAKMYRKEAPWESAQKELLKINAYKTPTDKLKCVKRCCATIMNLLCMASETSVPGADEFVPALVYVVIHANPPGLLSTVQYITNFYEEQLSGEEAYYWMQFCAAVAFIKTLR